MTKKRVYILHGYNATSKSHWFPWLRKTLSTNNISVQLLELPEPTAPNREVWLNKLAENITILDENTYFVAHSLGCITLLHYLDSLTVEAQLGGMILVSGFADKLSTLPELNPFVERPIDSNKISNMLHKRIVLSARNDQIVPTAQSQKLAYQLKADFIQLESGGHFLTEDGFITFSLVYHLLHDLIQT